MVIGAFSSLIDEESVGVATGGLVNAVGRRSVLYQAVQHVVAEAAHHAIEIFIFDQLATNDRLRGAGRRFERAAGCFVGFFGLQPGRITVEIIGDLIAPGGTGRETVHAELMLVGAAMQEWIFRHVQVVAVITVQQVFCFCFLPASACLDLDLEGVLVLQCQPVVGQLLGCGLGQSG